MGKIKVLFVCIHNSARSQMAEAFLNKFGGDRFEAQSAGLEPGKLNPIVVEAMQDIGIYISGNKTKSVMEFFENNAVFNYVIAVCDAASAGKCPFFPGGQNIHWSFPDPSVLTGTHEEKLQKTREIRDLIKAKIEELIKTTEINE